MAIQFESVRAVVDAKFVVLAEGLSEAYYKHWKLGQSKPWKGFDAQATPEQSKALFDLIHGAIWWMHEIALVEENDRQGKAYPDASINPQRSGESRAERLRRLFAALPENVRTALANAAR